MTTLFDVLLLCSALAPQEPGSVAAHGTTLEAETLFRLRGEPAESEPAAVDPFAEAEPILRVSVDEARAWLLEHQAEDGGWSVATDGPSSAAETAWVARALFDCGERLDSATGSPELRSAVLFLCRWLQGVEAGEPTDATIEPAEVVATLAVVEANPPGLRMPNLGRQADRALRRLEALRQPGGGWVIRTSSGDETTTITALAALARHAGRSVWMPNEPATSDRRLAQWVGLEVDNPARWSPAAQERTTRAATLIVLGTLEGGSWSIPDSLAVASLFDDLDAAVGDPLASYVVGLGLAAALDRGLLGPAEWQAARPLLHDDVLITQTGDGSFPASERWRATGGGDASATALAVLALGIVARHGG